MSAATTIQPTAPLSLEAESARLEEIATELGKPHSEVQRLRQEIADAETASAAALQTWLDARLAGTDAGTKPEPPADLVAKRAELAQLEALDRSTQQVREALDRRRAEVSQQREAQRVSHELAVLEGLVTRDAEAANREINAAFAIAAKAFAKIVGIHAYLQSVANARGGSADPRSTPIHRILARLPKVHIATQYLEVADADVKAAQLAAARGCAMHGR
jgi:hypothetical protein